MIRRCTDTDFVTIYEVVNDAAMAYKDVIPADRWHGPYMPKAELRTAIDSGVEFWGVEQDGGLVGVMGIQPVQDVTLIRHAYVRTSHRRHGIGGQLLQFLLARIDTPTLIGTWAAADWAIRFYQKHGFRLVIPEEKDRLLPKYWGVPQRQIETSVVLGDQRWFDALLEEYPVVQEECACVGRACDDSPALTSFPPWPTDESRSERRPPRSWTTSWTGTGRPWLAGTRPGRSTC